MQQESKVCILCEKEFFRHKVNDKGLRWSIRKYCSVPCQLKSIKGWNKGTKMDLSEDTRKKMVENAKRNIAKETLEQRKARMDKTNKTRKERGTVQRWKLGITGEADCNWKGEEATYNAKHRWIQKHWIKTEHCEICKQYTPAPLNTRLKFGTQWANISGEYKRLREDWLELCPKCHRNYDLSK